MLELDDARVALRRELGEIVDCLDHLEPPLWTSTTGLDEWRIVDLARHLVWGQRLQALAWAQLNAGSLSARVPDEPTSSAPGDLVAELRSAHEEFMTELAVVGNAQLGQSCPLPYGVLPGGFVLQIAVMEAGVHHYDLAASIATRHELPADVTTACLAVVPGLLQTMSTASAEPIDEGLSYRFAGDRLDLTIRREADTWKIGDVDEPACVISGPDADLILFVLGRIDCTSPSLAVQNVTDAAAFKRRFPGP